MASFTVDAELMTNYVTASPVPAGSSFKTLLDIDGRPMVISLSDDKVPRLQIVRHDLKGLQYLFDLGACFDLPTDAIIQAFNVTQDDNKIVYLVFAYTRDGYSSRGVLTKPFSPKILQQGVKLSIITGPWTLGLVREIFLTPVPTSAGSSAAYPLVFVTHKNLEQSKSWGDDLTRLVPTPDLTSWSKDSSFSTPMNVAGIIDVATASNIHGQGLFVLYKTNDGTAKVYGEFVKLDSQSDEGSLFRWASEVQCPKDTTSIETFQDHSGDSALLFGAAQGLLYMDADSTIDKKSNPVLLGDQQKVQGCKSLVVAQDKSYLSIWFTSKNGSLGYIRCDTTVFQLRSFPDPVLLLPKESVTSFSPLLSGPTKALGQNLWQTLVSNDKNGNLTVLEQASDTGLWRKKPFYSNDKANNLAIKSYSITVKSFDANGTPLKNGSIRVNTSSAINGLLNGLAVTLTSSSNWFDTDDQGTLNFIIPTESLASQIITVNGLRDFQGGEIPVKETRYDPASRSMSRLGTQLKEMDSVEKLKNAQTQEGKPLFDANNMPADKDLENGLGSLKELHGAYNKLAGDSKATEELKTASVSSYMVSSSQVQGNFHTTSMLGDFEEWVMEKWNYIKEQADKAVKWVVDTSKKVWTFVCEIAGEVYKFVLDTLEKIGEALTWVWEKLKVAIQKLIDFIGFLFSWKDILKTKDTVAALITAGCDLSARKVGSAASTVDKWFDGMLKKIDNIGVPRDISASPNSRGGKGDTASKVDDVQSSTSFNWAGERMKNGGMSTSTDVKQTGSKSDDAQKTWDEIFTPALNGVRDAFSKVGQDIVALWRKKGEMTIKDLLDLIKDVMKAGVITIQKLVVSLIQAFQKVIQLVSEYGSKEISIPIFSKLYEKISGHKLTAFDAISLLVAIPTTIFTKMVTGKAPPQIPGLNADLLDGLVFGNTSVSISPQVRTDFNTLTAGLTVGATSVLAIVNLIRFALALANEGTGGAMKVLTSSPFIEICCVILDMFSALNAMPDDPDVPGYEVRKWISCITLVRGGAHIIATFVPTKGDSETSKDKLLLVLDIATTLVNFGLLQAVHDAELKAANSWKDYSEDSTVVSIQCSILNAVSGVGYFVGFMYKEKIQVSGAALIVLEAATVGLAALQGIKWKFDYDRSVRCMLLPSAT